MSDNLFDELIQMVNELPEGLISADVHKPKMKKRIYELWKIYREEYYEMGECEQD